MTTQPDSMTKPLTPVAKAALSLSIPQREMIVASGPDDIDGSEGVGMAICVIPNCGREAPASEAFCSQHRHEKRPYAYCCAEGGGDPAYCDCVNKNHGTALFPSTPSSKER